MGVQNSGLKKNVEALLKKIVDDNLTGRRIFLLGSSEFGPTNTPIKIKSTTGLYNRFGKQGTLINAFHEIKYTSKNNELYLVKTTGEHAVAYLNFNIEDGEIIENGVWFVAKDSNEVYNDIVIRPDITKLTIEYPESFGGYSISYYYNDYDTIDDLSKAVNKDASIGKGFVYLYYNVDFYSKLENAFFACNLPEVYMYGGRCGLNYTKDMLYNCLNKTYQMLESESIDIIVPVDAFLDDVHPYDKDDQEFEYGKKYYQSNKDYLSNTPIGNSLSFLDQLINFCTKQNQFGLVTIGVMGFGPIFKRYTKELGNADEIVTTYKACLKYNLECCEKPDYSFLVSVVAGDIEYNHGTIIDNGYLAYASGLSSYRYTDGITNNPFSNSISLYNEFDSTAMYELQKSGIICFRQSIYYDQPVVFDAITIYQYDNGYRNAANVRMIGITLSYINELFRLYIGENMVQLIKDGIINQQINQLLGSLKSKKVLTNYDFEVISNYTSGYIKVYLKLNTIFSIKGISLCSIVQLELEEDL